MPHTKHERIVTAIEEEFVKNGDEPLTHAEVADAVYADVDKIDRGLAQLVTEGKLTHKVVNCVDCYYPES